MSVLLTDRGNKRARGVNGKAGQRRVRGVLTGVARSIDVRKEKAASHLIGMFLSADGESIYTPAFLNKIYLCERHWAANDQRFLLAMDAIRDQSRVSRVRDFTVLVGFSKLSVPAQACLAAIESLEFPLVYEDDERRLSSRAARFGHNTFGSGEAGGG